jgi:glycosyltransferase involved in cell wall biosynthesis
VTVALFQRNDRTSEALAGWIGLLIHRAASALRHLVASTAKPDPMNIAVLCDAFLRYGSAQAIGLSQAGLSVTLYYIDRVDEFGNHAEDRAIFLDRARAAGVELVPLPRRRMRSLLKHAWWLHRDLRRRKVAVAVVQSHIDPRYATLGLAFPVVLMLHDPQTHSGDTLSTFPAPVRLISRIAELTSFCLIIHSDQLLEQIRPLLRRLPIGVVPHGTEMASAPAHIPHERRLLVFGRLFAYKGVDTALQAFQLLPESLSDAKLVVAGRGPLAALARSQQNVEVYEEYITDPDADTLLKDARLVLLPYKDATQSGVGLQAVAHGVPCVVSSAGALPELVPDSLPGLVVPPDNPARLAEAIVAHIDHDDGLRRAIHEHAAADFTWLAVAHRLRSELQRLGLEGAGSRNVACTDTVKARS